MINSVSHIIKHPVLEDFYCIIINRTEPEINNNKPYNQKVMGSKKSVKWFRKNILEQMQKQNTR